MQALRLQAGSKQEAVEQVDIPKLGPEDVLIRVKSAGLAAGVFGLARLGLLRPLPATLGSEAAGVVELVGDEVKNFKPGVRVRVHTSVSCRACKFCLTDRDQMCPEAGIMGFQGYSQGPMPMFQRYRDGGLAEYIKAPHWLLDVLPENISFDVATKVNELATAKRTLERGNLPAGATIIVTSPTGTMGTSILKIAKFFPISHIVLIGRNTERLQAVQKLTSIKTDIVGLDQLSSDWTSTGKLGARVRAVIPAGADAYYDLTQSGKDMWQAMAGLRTNGTFVHLGGNVSQFSLPVVAIMANCWTLVGTRNHSRNDAKEILKWLADGDLNIDELITHRWKFSQVTEAIARLQDRSLPIWMSVGQL